MKWIKKLFKLFQPHQAILVKMDDKNAKMIITIVGKRRRQ